MTVEMITKAGREISPAFLNTPVVEAEALNEKLGASVSLKVETLTPIRCFKGRGADFLVASIKDGAGKGAVCASAGNFGQGIAWAGRHYGVPVTVFAAKNANPMKLDAMRRLSAEVITTGTDLDEAKDAAENHAAEHGQMFLVDGRHDEGIAGAGTIALELTRDCEPFDIVLVPLGNGALVNGIGTWMKDKSPATKITAVAAEGAPSMEKSWREQRQVETPSVETIADGLAVRVPIMSAVDTMQSTTDEVLLVSDSSMKEAMKLLFETTGLVVEPSGAIGIGAILEQPEMFKGKRVATILCGGNVTPEQARAWLF
ncbi:MAG: threonine ammonia-lyase [Hyphomicrobiales bacterium]